MVPDSKATDDIYSGPRVLMQIGVLTTLVLLLSVALPARAQETGVIQGTVTDAESGAPLPGANVALEEAQRGASTDAEGRYRFGGLAPGTYTLQFTFVGYQAASREVQLEAGGMEELDVALTPSVVGLDEMVVTAFGIDRERRALGYSIQDLEGEELAEVPTPNVMESLAGKLAGVDITGGSAGLASSPRITIRGESSLSGNNRPLVVVDGVPVDNSINTAFAGAQFTQVDFGDALDQINPDDIEEVSVLKGPSAAALYGSRAASGVILITTKSGEGVDGVGVSVRSSSTASDILRLPDYQDEYGAGAGGEYQFVNGDGTDGGKDGQGYNWGPPLDEGLMVTQFGSPRDEDGNLIAIPFASHPGNVRQFFNTGTNFTNNVALYGSSDRGNFRLSLTRMDRTGVVPNTELRRNNVSLAAGYELTPRLSVNTHVNYVTSGSDNLPTSGYGSESIMYSFLWWGRHLDTDWLRDYWMEGQEGLQQRNFDMNWTNNVYFQVFENTNSLDRDRLYGNLSTAYDVSDRLRLRVRTGLDYHDQTTDMRKAFSSVTAPNGHYRTNDARFEEWNSDVLLTYSSDLGEDWHTEVSAGGNHMEQRREAVSITAPELSVPGIYNVGNSRVNVQTSQYRQKKVINSLYGRGEVSYRELVYLDLTARNDWSSTLPVDNNSYFYPSVALSAVLSDIFGVPEASPLSFAKVRLSWAQVGSDTDPYRLRNTYNYDQAWGGLQTVSVPAELANARLKPEILTSYEAGADVRFFERRLGLDLTYYVNNSRNQILRVPLASSTGYTGRYINAGRIINRGWELVLDAAPLRDLYGLDWDLRLNWSRNRSHVEELTSGIDTYLIANPYGGTVEARVGGRMGDMYGRVFQRSPEGEIIYQDGLPLLTEDVRRIGNYNHDWTAGIGNTFSYGPLSFRALFDLRYGGRIYSYTHATGIEGGTLEGTTAHRGEQIVGEGVVRNEDGTYSENTTPADYVTWLRRYYARGNIESNSFDATYAKLREARLSYRVPDRLLSGLFARRASLSLIGRDLFLWTDVPHIDPETTFKDGQERVPGFEVVQLPSTRSVGLSLNVDF